MDVTHLSLLYACFAALCFILGGSFSFARQPNRVTHSISQHFAAGVVFAAVALELIPKISEVKMPLTLITGFGIGVLLMLLIKNYSEKQLHGEQSSTHRSIGLLTAVGVDLFIDGLLVGIAFAAGERGGILIALALAIEVFSLGLATLANLKENGLSFIKRLFPLCLLGLLLVLGALVSVGILQVVNSYVLHGILSFGVAALLYLVTEELLEQAHQVQDTPFVTASFFFGFLAIFVIDTQLHLF
jgi:ZIP family zinc transporter